MEKGTVFPENVAQVHQLFSNGELWFTMSNNDAEVVDKIAEAFSNSTMVMYQSLEQFKTTLHRNIV
jgi:putative spermidine/putrescine transport system substrate-binding protein